MRGTDQSSGASKARHRNGAQRTAPNLHIVLQNLADRKAVLLTAWPRRRDLGDHPAVSPPSTTSSAPVVNADSSLARNRIVRAISIGFASRPSGAALAQLAPRLR